MKHIDRWFIAILVIAISLLSACGSKAATAEKEPPYKLEDIEGVDFKRVRLTEKADAFFFYKIH